MGHPTGENISSEQEQRIPEERKEEPVNKEDYLDEKMFIVISEPARPVVTSEQIPEAIAEALTLKSHSATCLFPQTISLMYHS